DQLTPQEFAVLLALPHSIPGSKQSPQTHLRLLVFVANTSLGPTPDAHAVDRPPAEGLRFHGSRPPPSHRAASRRPDRSATREPCRRAPRRAARGREAPGRPGPTHRRRRPL